MTGRLLRLTVILVLLFAVNAAAAASIPVVVKLLPGANISLISSLPGAIPADSIRGANAYLLRLASSPELNVDRPTAGFMDEEVQAR